MIFRRKRRLLWMEKEKIVDGGPGKCTFEAHSYILRVRNTWVMQVPLRSSRQCNSSQNVDNDEAGSMLTAITKGINRRVKAWSSRGVSPSLLSY
jgi:hypothetical protein